jgi:NADH dehydrogenase
MVQSTSCSCSESVEQSAVCVPKTNYKRLVVIGGGFAGLELIKGLKNKKNQIVLIDKNNFHQFQPLLYQVATSSLEPDSITFPIRKQLEGFKNVSIRYAKVAKIESDINIIQTNKGNLTYDYLVIATGTTTNFFGLKSVEENSLGLKDIRDALNIRHMMLQNLEQATITCNEDEKKALTNFVIVGGGLAGIEMAGALAEFCRYILPKVYPEYQPSIMKIYLLEASNSILSVMSENASDKALKFLKSLNVHVLLNEAVISYNGKVVKTKSGKEIFAKNFIWTAGVKGKFPEGIDKQHIVGGNRIKTNENLKVEDYSNIYAIGDIVAIITNNTPKGHPQVAQPAIQQGKYLANNFFKILENKPLQPFKYNDKGSLATIGKTKTVTDIGSLKFSGYVAWLLWPFIHLM